MKKLYMMMTLCMGKLLMLPVFAYAGDKDPFAEATEKANKWTEYMTGSWAVAFFTLVIAGAGFAWAMNMLSKKWAINIIAGAIVVGCCTYLADFFLS